MSAGRLLEEIRTDVLADPPMDFDKWLLLTYKARLRRAPSSSGEAVF